MMPEGSLHSKRLHALAAASIALTMLSACSTSKATHAEPSIVEQPSAETARQKAAQDTSVSGYVDPALVSASSTSQSADSATIDEMAGGSSVPGTTMEQGIVAQPTGIRAGSASIFSGPAPVASDPLPAEPYPVPVATGRIDARSGSMFSAPAATATQQGCGIDGLGFPISC